MIKRWPSWWYRLPFPVRYWLHVVGSWTQVTLELLLIPPIAVVFVPLCWLLKTLRELPEHAVGTWNEHRSRLRIYRAIADRADRNAKPAGGGL